MAAPDDTVWRLLAAHAGEVEHGGIWLRARMDRLDPAQRSGWKLHLSATPASYINMLDSALPILAAHGHPFKALGDIDEVERICAGERGLMQVGKTLTVYPPTEAAAAAMALELRMALRGMPGPAIPSDLPYCDDAPIYFRFGPYDGRFEIDAMGQERRLLWRPDLGHDVWDLTSGGPAEGPPSMHLPRHAPPDHLAFLREEYRLLRMLQLTAKGGVFAGVREGAKPPEGLLIKTARPGANSDAQGRDAVWALQREHALLSALGDVPGLPAPGALLESAGASAIVRPFLFGETFWELWTRPDARLATHRARLARALSEIAETLEELHARGLAARDVSPGNIVIAEDRAYLMDLELAERIGDTAQPYRRGTRGFFDPRKRRGAPASAEDDAFALRALHAMIGEGALPATVFAQLGAPAAGRPEAPPCSEFLQEAFAGIDRDSHAQDTWNVYSGAAGLLLAAATCKVPVASLGMPDDIASRIAAAAERVLHLPGFHFGASGMAVAIGTLEHSAGSRDTPRALDLLTRTATETSAAPDICQGIAGKLLACVTLHELTGNPALLALTSPCVARLNALASLDEGERVWRWPEGPFGDLSGAACHGFGHGVAGVTFALLRLHEILPSDELLEEIAHGLRTLERAALPVPGAQDAAWWPVSAQDESCWNAWCHGTPGVIKALARARRNRIDGPDDGLLARALRGMYLANNSELCLCHGVASRLDAWNDCAALTDFTPPEPLHALALADAQLLAHALRGPSTDRIKIFGDAEGNGSHGLMTGMTGAMLALNGYVRA